MEENKEKMDKEKDKKDKVEDMAQDTKTDVTSEDNTVGEKEEKDNPDHKDEIKEAAHETASENVEAETASEAEKEQETGSEEEDAAEGETENAEEGTVKKGFFKKNKKKDKKDEKIEELTDQVKRQMAEFDNFRKRTEKEKSQMYEIGAKSIIEKVLPVVDNFERGLAAVPEENQEDAFVDGMNKVYKQMMTMLEEAGVVPIEAVGREFDPNLHNAVMQTESEEYESGIVAQELQKGYMYRDSVVRHSMVAVVN